MKHPTPHSSDKPAPPEVPAVMRAAVRRRYGGSDAIEVVDVQTPAVADGGVLVEVSAAALNPLDWHMLTGTPWLVRPQAGVRRPKNPAMGVDFAGRVVAVGSDATDVAVGDDVMGVSNGAFAQYVAADVTRLVPKPPEVDMCQAAGIGVAGVTALQGLRDHGGLAPSGPTDRLDPPKVLVNGASGGVGAAAVQLANWMGAEITAVCSGRNADLVQSLGADHVIDYETEDFTDTDQRFQLLFDNQGNRPLRACRNLLTDDGVYLLVGGPKKNRAWGPVGRLLRAFALFAVSKPKAKTFVADERADDLAVLADLMATGRLRVPIAAVYPMADIRSAMDRLAGGHVSGKLLIEP